MCKYIMMRLSGVFKIILKDGDMTKIVNVLSILLSINKVLNEKTQIYSYKYKLKKGGQRRIYLSNVSL